MTQITEKNMAQITEKEWSWNWKQNIRPKRNDHMRLARGTTWIGQEDYDAVCSYFNAKSDAKLKGLIRRITATVPAPIGITSARDRYTLNIPRHPTTAVDAGAVLWIAKATLKERKARRRLEKGGTGEPRPARRKKFQG